MRIQVRFLASYAEQVESPDLSLEVAPRTTVEALIAELRARHPAWDAERPLVARNLEYAQPGEVLQDGDVVALFPPVSGG